MKNFIYLAALFFSLFLFSLPGKAATNITVKHPITIEGTSNEEKPLTNKVIELQGPSSSTDFYYSLEESVRNKKHSANFHLEHSELLKSPSSFTVQVDGLPVKSISLAGKKTNNSVTIDLPKRALTKGDHTITASFYGVVKEGVCVAPGDQGNWLKIDVLSTISSFAKEKKEIALSDYPSAFQTGNTQIVLPDNPSTATLNSAYQLAAFLSEEEDSEATVTRETHLRSVKGPVIFIGAKDEFKTSEIQRIFSKANVSYKDGISLKSGILHNQGSKNEVPALFVTADSSSTIEQRIDLLLKEDLTKQLSGKQMTVDQLPQSKKKDGTHIKLNELGFKSETLSGGNTTSKDYYVSLPRMEEDNQANLHLYLKKSATMPAKDEANGRKTELILYVNDVPHSIDLSKLKKTQSGIYEANVPIQTNLLNKHSLVDLRFEVTGFQLEDPCEHTGERFELYIDGDSTLNLAKKANNTVFSLRDYPNAFDHQTLIIMPNQKQVSDSQMLALYKTLFINGELPPIKLKKEKEVSQAELQKYALIFAGEANDFNLLKDRRDQLPLSDEKLMEEGFLPQSVASTAYITQNFWQSSEPLLVLENREQSLKDDDFYRQLKNSSANKSAAVETKDGRFIVSTKKVTETNNVSKKDTRKQAVHYIVGFVVLIAAIALILYMAIRRKKKNTTNNEK